MKYFRIRKINIFFHLLMNSNFIFRRPENKKLIIFDCVNTHNLFQTISEKNYFILSTRINKIKNIYLSTNILFYILLNFFKRSLKQNYIIALIKNISPKLVLTNVENSSDFHIAAKAFENKKIKFLAIQTSDLTGTNYLQKNKKESKIFYIPEFLCFSAYEKEIFTTSEKKIKIFNIVGSLMSSLANEFVIKNNIKIIPDKYDICLISEPVVDQNLEEEFERTTDYFKAPGIVAEYVHRLCSKNNFKLIFSGKKKLDDPNLEEEENYYKKYLKSYNFKIYQPLKNGYGTHLNIMQSKLIIGTSSTALREAFSFKKKVLSCNITNHPGINYPSGGLSVLNSSSYNDFEERVLKILSLDTEEYEKKLNKKMEFTMLPTTNTANLIRNKINEYLR